MIGSQRLINTLLISFLFISSPLSAKPQSFIRDYTYQASEADSKLSCRSLAMEEVKKLLLSELGTHISHELNATKKQDGTTYADENITAITAGIAKVDILEERWNGVTYYIRAKMEADPEEVLKSVKDARQRNDYQKRYKEMKYRKGVVEKEIERLRNELSRVKTDKKLNEQRAQEKMMALERDYQENTNKVNAIEFYLDGIQNFYRASYDDAFYLFRRAADLGYGAAQIKLSECYSDGLGVEKNIEKKLFYYKKAMFNIKKEALLGDRNSQYEMALWLNDPYFFSEDERKKYKIDDIDKSIKTWKGYSTKDQKMLNNYIYWYEKAASNGHLESLYLMSVISLENENPPNKSKSDAWGKKLYNLVYKKAQTEDIDACFYMGALYFEGKYVDQDAAKGIQYYRCAAAGGDTAAEDALIYIFSGFYGNQYANFNKLMNFNPKDSDSLAAKNYEIGKMYEKGTAGAEKDINKAIQHYTKALVTDTFTCSQAAGALKSLNIKLKDSCY